ncbi:RNA methyltransferase [Granulicella sp. L60]|uniref:RNA methyltransferase n=1 Tax=Granulicella sp. L60 TaxID=1641866 RepID=UPI00131D6E0C|nr:TrmJ/YjtD family RNA methyltransferase [Granulicella sp. L60]
MENVQNLDDVVVVLVRARNPNNIGAVARAMHDFGFRHLRVVNDYAVPFETARSAVDASAVLDGAKTFAGVAEAVADCTLVVGTTAVGERALQHPVYALADAGERIGREMAGQGRVALLFGSEKTGLSNDELSHCHWLLTIPMQEHEGVRHPSMNLGQAVAVCLYELVRGVEFRGDAGSDAATAGEVERLTALFAEMLEETGYTKRHPANCDEAQIRRLVVRMGLKADDVPVWMGVLRQVLWKVRGRGEGAE